MLRIVVVQTAFLGDVVLTTPLLRELRRARPDARLAVVTTAAGRRLLAGTAGIDELLIFDKRWRPAGLASFVRLVGALRRGRFDVAIAAQRSHRTGQLLWCSRARLRIGFEGAPGAWSYHRLVPWRADDHAVRRYLDLATPLGGEPATADPWPRLAVDPVADRDIAHRLEAGGLEGVPWICVAPGSARFTKRWQPEGFAEVIRRLAARGLSSVLVGTAAEGALCRRIAASSGARPMVLAGVTDVAGLVALAARARVALANDNGAGHVAAAVGTPVVTIFGPTSPAAGYAPLGAPARAVERADLACRPCSSHGPRRCPLGHLACMRELRPEAVAAAVLALVDDPLASAEAGERTRRQA